MPVQAPQNAADDAPRLSFATRHRDLLLGLLSVVLIFAAWQAVFLFVPFNKLFISKPDLIALGFVDLIRSGTLLRDLAVSAVPSAFQAGRSASNGSIGSPWSRTSKCR